MNIAEREFYCKVHEALTNGYYDLDVFVSPYEINLSKHGMLNARLKRYHHVQIIEQNGFGIGQLHCITDEKQYLMLPWAYILAITPCKE